MAAQARLTAERAPVPIVRHMSRASPRVALTYDDCDDEAAWLQILDVLDAYGVRGSFFPSGMRVHAFPAAARATIARGHTVGSHGANHRRLVGLSPEELDEELAQDRRAWQVIGRERPELFRPPYGAHDENVRRAVARAGFARIVMWDVDPRDWEPAPPEAIARRVVDAARAGSIVDLHVTSATARALPMTIEGLRRRGLEPIALAALSANRARATLANRRQFSSPGDEDRLKDGSARMERAGQGSARLEQLREGGLVEHVDAEL